MKKFISFLSLFLMFALSYTFAQCNPPEPVPNSKVSLIAQPSVGISTEIQNAENVFSILSPNNEIGVIFKDNNGHVKTLHCRSYTLKNDIYTFKVKFDNYTRGFNGEDVKPQRKGKNQKPYHFEKYYLPKGKIVAIGKIR